MEGLESDSYPDAISSVALDGSSSLVQFPGRMDRKVVGSVVADWVGMMRFVVNLLYSEGCPEEEIFSVPRTR